eukprot:TRINITY_DN14792_c0_g1_i1.p1 TRINITY_DN14792_c0_g1~~TRINITY_DN14792_c0_g1_i1.p1  ORF type:complete len:120 (-),score=57.13 TRINITY_DN14792_c0_g1_i1:3-311(-)
MTVKDPSNIREFTLKPPRKADEPDPDDGLAVLLPILTMGFSFAGIFLKQRLFCFVAITLSIISIARARSGQADTRNLMTSIAMSFVTIMFSYSQPAPAAPAS